MTSDREQEDEEVTCWWGGRPQTTWAGRSPGKRASVRGGAADALKEGASEEWRSVQLELSLQREAPFVVRGEAIEAARGH